MELNSEQKEAVIFLKKWWQSPAKYAILHGPAGTGKTTIVKDVIKEFRSCKALFTAPTNAATKQLQESLPKDYDVRTTFSALGFHFDSSTEEKFLTRKSVPGFLNDYNLLTVDEASFIGEKKSCKLADGSKISLLDGLLATDFKILFIGHKSQLPEVEENVSIFDKCESVVFQQDWPTFNLTTIERNKGELQEYIQSLEHLIYNDKAYFKNKYPLTEKKQVQYINSLEGRIELLEGETKMLAYRNVEVDKYNNITRKSLFGDKVETFVPHDRIILIKPATYLGRVSELNEGKILTLFKESTELPANTKALVLAVKRKILLDVSCYELEVDIEGTVLTLYVPIYPEEVRQYAYKLKKIAWAVSSKAAKAKEFEKMHKLLSLFSTVKYDYCSTVHRAQGANINKVIVLWDDIQRCQNKVLRQKLLYVGVSRAKQELLIRS